ncbi:MAG: DNA-deoxyinosine glycosylase [Gammaproteobacteria bacterium]|nr:DNA-deoxyinosine glycosylase [Gammaproteobacteria bacterium]MBU1602321.1 DNA-deoxyinosine glycosylase [Gammaproteobacteria bacterium]MBU2433127.1 DNA-deoxyinosine glycosylase [Gammaproteobacteria bacterium]MBU2451041.1 DNA-deoxyinosine glycosylase [Gammaproteobacteria bacterium]
MSLSRGFPPVADRSARVLVLGSLPGKASLAAQAYYANRQNVFWRIMGDLLGAGPELPYGQRLEKLQAAGIALWDVIAAGERPGSLDSAIVRDSVCVNDFSAFFAVHRGIGRVFFNGAAAEATFRRHVLPGLAGEKPELIRLPSTSPAHAASSYADKLAAWSAIVAPVNK